VAHAAGKTIAVSWKTFQEERWKTDEAAIKTLQSRDFFKHYTEKTRQVAGGEVVVTPLELIAETTPG